MEHMEYRWRCNSKRKVLVERAYCRLENKRSHPNEDVRERRPSNSVLTRGGLTTTLYSKSAGTIMI